MRSRNLLLLSSAAFLTLAGLMVGQQQGPLKDPSVTVAKPRKADDKKDPDTDLPKIPSQYNKKDKVDLGELPSFKSDVDIVTVDVAIVDNKGHFIPGIPKGNFRILEDNVPQQLRSVTLGEAPL